MSGTSYALLFSTIMCLVVGSVSIAVALRERGRGSAMGLLPGAAGILLLVGCAGRLRVLAA